MFCFIKTNKIKLTSFIILNHQILLNQLIFIFSGNNNDPLILSIKTGLKYGPLGN